MVKILHTADLHLDNGFISSDLPYNIIKDRQKDLIRTFENIIEIAKKERVELFLISGDLFEHKYIDTKTIHYVNHSLGELKGTYIFILPGNHDGYHLMPYYKNYPWSKNIFIFKDEYQKVELKDLNTVVHGIGYGYQEDDRPLLERLIAPDSETINILLYHGSDMTQAPKKESKYLPFNQEDLVNANFNYIALGHYHQYRKYKDIFGNTIAAYPGSPEPLAFDELGEHGIILGEITKEKNNLSMIALSNRQYINLQVDITGCTEAFEIKDRVVKAIAPHQPEHNLFTINLLGDFSWETGLTIDFIKNQTEDIAYYIRYIDDTRPIEVLGDFSHNTLLTTYLLELQARLEREPDLRRKRILKKAMDIGKTILRGEKHKI